MRAFFVRKLHFGSFSSYVSALAPKFCTKNARVNVDEIDTWCPLLASSSRRGMKVMVTDFDKYGAKRKTFPDSVPRIKIKKIARHNVVDKFIL
jgi:hypothetical protein